MSTPDGLPPGPHPVPGEVSLHAPQRTLLSSPAALPSSTPTPGTSAAALKVPTAPTVPDADPASLTLVIGHLARDLFGGAAPETSPLLSSPSPLPPPSSPVPSSSVPSSSVPSSSVPSSSVPSSSVPSSPLSSSPLSSSPLSSSPLSSSPLSSTTPSPSPAATTAHPFSSTPDFSSVFLSGHSSGHSSSGPPHEGLPDAFSVPLVDAFDPPSRAPVLPSSSSTPLTPSSPLSHSSPPAASAPFAYEVGTLVAPAARPSSSPSGFDARAIKAEFPILQQRVHGRPLVWLDNAATTQKPRAVIERLQRFYEHENSNIHRAAHTLAARATDAYEQARETVRRFVNAPSVRDVIFVRGTTEGINLVAQSWGRHHIGADDEIVLTHLEHHANIVPWQLLAREKGARLKVAPVDDDGQIRLPEYERLLAGRVKLVAMTHVSNALGTVTPAAEMIAMAKRRGIPVLLDGAQSVSHQRVDLAVLQPDFFVFSGHKIFGPTGIGVVVAPHELMDATPPWQGGGNMIADVTFERTLFQPAPARFEAGTGNIADAVGLGAALEWVERVGLENIARHEHDLLDHGTRRLCTVPGLRIVGTAADKAGVLSFVVDGHDTQAMSRALDQEGIAVRGGHHCAQPILRRFGLQSTVRASLAPYNTHDDLDALVDAVLRIVTRGA